MDSPLTRVILATIGAYLLLLLFLSVSDWFAEQYPQRPPEATQSERIQHPRHHREAVNALQLFSRLPEPEKAAVRERLESSLISVEQWITHLRESNCQILCMGELHRESTRSFLSKKFFSNFSVDVLLLEATPEKLKSFIKRMKAGRDYFPLLGADIMDLLRNVGKRNPAVRIFGIEETDAQQNAKRGPSNPRDQSIAHNFWAKFRPGERHVILFGALHCTNEPNWLFHNLRKQASRTLKDDMLNVRVLGEHQNGPLEAFVYFMDEIGIEKKHFVIPDTRLLPDPVYKWFPSLNRQTLATYRSLIVFRT